MSEVTLRQLEYFLAALDAGTITGAAEMCRVTQATVSTALNELERTVGTRLLVRSRTAGVQPTTAGTALVTRARAMLDLAREIPEVAMGEQSNIVGTVRIGCVFPLAPYLLPQIIADFAGPHPGLRVAFVEGATVDLCRELDIGRLDLVFTFGAQLPATAPRREIVRFRQNIMISSAHPLAHRRQVEFRDVADIPVILYSQPPSRDRVETMIRASGVEPNVMWESSSPETVRALVKCGLGYSVGNLRPDIAGVGTGGGIAFIPIAAPHPLNSIVALHAPADPPPRRVSAIIDYCEATAPTWDWLSK